MHYATLFTLLTLTLSTAIDQHENCQYWASIGECDKNPAYMLQSCADSCRTYAKSSLPPPVDFYSIVENDINGNQVSFERFRGKVVFIMNVASYCGYTAEGYDLLKSLAPLRSNSFEILIYPCNQFGAQEPGDSQAISVFAQSKGFEGVIMEKGDVNGVNARPTFVFLKDRTAKKHINWNFDGRFIIDQNGNARHVTGDIKEVIVDLLSKTDL